MSEIFIPPLKDAFIRDDKWGSGAWMASRKTRLHRGIDYSSSSHSIEVLAPSDGVVSKVGYCYQNNFHFKYIAIRATNGLVIRLLYVEPGKKVGAVVKKGDVVGENQSLDSRYRGITTHVHTEVKISPEFVLLNKGFRIRYPIQSLWIDPELFISLKEG